MYLLLIGLTLLMGLGVGWSIGANDAANSIGTAVGSKVITLRRAILLITVFGFLGAILQGGHVVKTIGNGIVPMGRLDRPMALCLALAASSAASAWVVLATYHKIPVSTSHSIVGAVAGAGLAIHAPVQWKVIIDVFVCWIITPIGAALLGYLFFLLFKNTLYRIIPSKYLRMTLSSLIVASSCYMAFTWGANDVSNSVGVLVGAGVLSPSMSAILGSAAIILGITTWGYKVIETVGTGITHLLPIMAFSAQLASAINVHVYTLLGIPVSTSHSIVGAIFGVGLVKGLHVLNLRILREIVVCWLATPLVSGIISFVAMVILVWITQRPTP